MQLIAGMTGLSRPAAPTADRVPLIVAIHGGTYTSAYFDVPGHSLLDRAEANGIPIVAIDRPGYGGTPALPPEQSDIDTQAAHLLEPLARLWPAYGAGCAGMVLIGHSIGGAIAASIASKNVDLPLLGLAVSGVGLRTPSDLQAGFAALPDQPFLNLPLEQKDAVMFGPPGSFAAAMPTAQHAADAAMPRAEVIDINFGWEQRVREVLGRVRVPVHYRQGEIDRLWIIDEDEVRGFAAACTQAPYVDARMVPGTGHCIDFHHAGAALQLQQLAFAMQCAAEA